MFLLSLFLFLLIEGHQPAKAIFHPTPPQSMCLNRKAQKKCFDTFVEHLFCGIAVIETISARCIEPKLLVSVPLSARFLDRPHVGKDNVVYSLITARRRPKL